MSTKCVEEGVSAMVYRGASTSVFDLPSIQATAMPPAKDCLSRTRGLFSNAARFNVSHLMKPPTQ
ncbi:hypothetical protein D3C83_156330 [compost metagenome]